MALYSNFIFLLSGWLVSRFLLSLVRPFVVVDIVIELGIVLVTLLPFAGLLKSLNRKQVQRFFAFSVGVISDSWYYWLTRPGNDIEVVISSPFDPVMWVVSGISLVMAITGFWIGAGTNRYLILQKRRFYYWHILVCILTVAVFRITYLLTMHLPNEDRSTFVAGVEVHHIIYGAFFLLFLSTLGGWGKVFRSGWLSALTGISIAMVFDQTAYMSAFHVTDNSYNSAASWVGAILLTGIYCSAVYIKGATVQEQS